MKRAIKQWISPKHPNYNLFEERLNSFTNWPRDSPSPKSLSEAGFFFSGKYKSIFSFIINFQKFYFHLYSKILTFQEEGMRQFAFAAGLVFTNGYLQTMRGENTHVGLLIVFFVRYIRVPAFVRESRRLGSLQNTDSLEEELLYVL